MNCVILDGNEMTSIDAAHNYLASKLNFPNYYGRNLDALWDILTTVSEPINIKMVNEDKFINNLGDYAKSFLKVIEEAAKANEKLIFNILDSCDYEID